MIDGLFDDPDLEWLRKRAVAHFESSKGGHKNIQKRPLFAGAYVPALLFTKESDLLLVDVMKRAASVTVITDLVQEALVREEAASVSIAILQNDPTTNRPTKTSNDILMRLKRLGIGLWLFGEKDYVELLPAGNFALRVVLPDPQKEDGELSELTDKFNHGKPEDALDGLSKRIEGLTEKLALKVVAKGKVASSKAQIEKMSFADQIELLAPHKSTKLPTHIPWPLAHDLNSFRGARNLAHHPPMTKKARAQLRRQMRERMMMGFRLDYEIRQVKIK